MDRREAILNAIPPHKAWRLRGRRYQQGMCNVIGKRFYDEVPNQLLHKKIGFSLYGAPTEFTNGNQELTYTKEKNEKIEKLVNHILTKNTNSNDTFIAFVYIHLRCKDSKKYEGISVVFRILQGPLTDANIDNYYFMDSNGRNYKDWQDFLEENTLPQCDMCVPKNGIYSEFKGRVELSYVESPSCRLGKKVLNCLDNTSTVLGVAATGASLACLAPAAAAFAVPLSLGAGAAIVASGVYDAGRSIAKLVDCGKHEESLSLKNAKARGLWLGLATSSLGAAATGGRFIGKARSFFKAGEAIIEAESAFLRFVNFSSLAVSGVTIINSLVNAVIKYREGTLERIDILQFIDACYFFINALITTEIAHWLIGTVATGDPKGMCFTKIREFGIVDTLIDVRNDRNYRLLMKLIGQNKYMPKVDLNEIDRISATLLRHVRDVSSGKMSWPEFMIEMTGVSRTLWLKFKEPVIAAVNKLLEINNATDAESIFIDPVHREIVHTKPDIARQLCLVVQKVIDQCNVDDEDGSIMKSIFALIFTFNSNYEDNFTVDFLQKARFVCECVSTKWDNLTDEYELARDTAESSCDNFDEVQFNRGFGFAHESDIPRCLLQRATYHLLAYVDDMQQYYEEDAGNSQPVTCEPPCLETNFGDCYIMIVRRLHVTTTTGICWQILQDYI
ncbi:uncharacterized protein LOC111055974 [Nilaparvata lugens]|uniref:uncharacterized protein LOC111055974 n=1 Tax=Nilaparvata lugens TaxID=108931 RepID=UPI00193D40EC|nr:uncharacterized protein LOC111055974 [Nilaparvata lugens]XP_039278001.1 uncharacterized protein LOC111055974 [Nilaparvata lugens]